MDPQVLPANTLGSRMILGAIHNGLQAVKDLARGCMNPAKVHMRFTLDASQAGRTPEEVCVTLMLYESYTNNSSYRGVAGLAEGSIPPDRLAGWSNYSPATGECTVREGKSAISATRREDQRARRSVPAQRIFAAMKGIADTGFIVAFGNRDDSHHLWAVDLARTITEPLLTCEAVLAESAFHLGSSVYVLSLLQDEMLRIAFDCARNLDQLRDLARRYEDRKPDLADLCLVRMSELYPRHTVITVDESDFRVYRRNKREVIPTICPPRA